jgi:hypothetical protein
MGNNSSPGFDEWLRIFHALTVLTDNQEGGLKMWTKLSHRNSVPAETLNFHEIFT